MFDSRKVLVSNIVFSTLYTNLVVHSSGFAVTSLFSSYSENITYLCRLTKGNTYIYVPSRIMTSLFSFLV